MKIPYGISDFGQIRSEGFFYADRTRFLPVLESAESGYRHLFFLRPRRFGKSTLLSMLEHYYDIQRAEQFDALFGGLWIHEHPTPERNRHLILSFDFSKVATDRGHDALFRTFFEAVRTAVESLLIAYRERVPVLARLDERLFTFQDPEALIGALIGVVRRSGHKLYVLIDEYDHFANRLLAAGSQDVYEKIVKDAGFVRSFFATLKSGTGAGAVARMFITGVSPLMLDDMSSGFNIASNVSLDPELNGMAGLTRAEIERAVDGLLADSPALRELPEVGDRGRLLDVLERYYNGYRFSPAATERIFNSDMALYFLSQVQRWKAYPVEMLDQNIRTDYRHLQRLGSLGGPLGEGRRALLETILGEGHIRSDLVRQFGVTSLSSHATYISLLYYVGMLTLKDAPRDGMGYDLEIPNRVIRELQWEHLALMLQEQEQVVLQLDDLKAALQKMAVEGDIQPFLDMFHERVIRKLGVKDTRRFDEKSIKLMLMTYLSLSRMFHVLSEKEFAQGYCDLFLGASVNLPGARFSWLLELKYLPTGAKPAQIEAAFAEAATQAERYASDGDLLPLLLGDRQLRAGMLVFVGAKKVLFRPWPEAPAAPSSRPVKARARPAKPAPKVAKKPAARPRRSV